jgi:hypothetical protein
MVVLSAALLFGVIVLAVGSSGRVQTAGIRLLKHHSGNETRFLSAENDYRGFRWQTVHIYGPIGAPDTAVRVQRRWCGGRVRYLHTQTAGVTQARPSDDTHTVWVAYELPVVALIAFVCVPLASRGVRSVLALWIANLRRPFDRWTRTRTRRGFPVDA